MPHVSRVLTVAAVLATALLFAACGSTSTDSASTGAPSAPQTSSGSSSSSGGGSTAGTPCALTTTAEITAVSGVPAADTPTGDAGACTWQPASGTSGGAKLQVDANPDAAHAVTAQSARGCAPTAPQVGDSSCAFSAQHELLFAKGNKLFTLSCSTATDAALLTWAQEVAGRA